MWTLDAFLTKGSLWKYVVEVEGGEGCIAQDPFLELGDGVKD
jgi:hypothetical protein